MMKNAISTLCALALLAHITVAEDDVFGRQLSQCYLTSNNNSCRNSYECASKCCTTNGYCNANDNGSCDNRTSCPDEKKQLSGGAIAGIVVASVFCWFPALVIVAVALLIVLSPFICAFLVVNWPCVLAALIFGSLVTVAGIFTAVATCCLYFVYTLDIIGTVKRYQAKKRRESATRPL